MAQTYIQPRHTKHDFPCIHAISMPLYFSLSHYHCLPPTSPLLSPRSSKKGTVIVFGNQQSQCNHSITKRPQKWESGERVSQPQRQCHTHHRKRGSTEKSRTSRGWQCTAWTSMPGGLSSQNGLCQKLTATSG